MPMIKSIPALDINNPLYCELSKLCGQIFYPSIYVKIGKYFEKEPDFLTFDGKNRVWLHLFKCQNASY